MACISIPTAMLISGALGVGGSIVSSTMAADASKKAAEQQAAAHAAAMKKLDPFLTAGKGGLAGVQNLLGLGKDGISGILKQLEATPGFQFVKGEGLKATQNSYTAKGLGQSGAALKGAAEYAEGLAGTTYQDIFKNFLDLANIGSTAGTTIGNLTVGQGNAQAAGTVGSTNALTSGIGSAISSLDNAALMLALNGAGMFGSNSKPLASIKGGAKGATNALDLSAWG